MNELLTYLVSCLVDDLDQITVTEVPAEGAVTYEVRVATSDLGKIIGKQGRLANALRTFVRAVAAKNKCKVYIEIVTPQETP